MRLPIMMMPILVLIMSLTSIEVLAAKNDNTSGTTKGGKVKGWARDKVEDPIANTAPSITITGPADGSSVEEGTALSFAGAASDNEDGNLSGAINWIPTGSNGIVILPVGVHTISASVTDSGGLTATDTVTVTVTAPIIDVGSISVSWDIPAARENGAALAPSELGGYEIYVSEETSGENLVVPISDPMTISHTINDLVKGTYYVAMTAIDTNGIFSEMSNVVIKSIQ